MVATLAKQTICNKRPGFERSDTLSFKEANRRLIFYNPPPLVHPNTDQRTLVGNRRCPKQARNEYDPNY